MPGMNTFLAFWNNADNLGPLFWQWLGMMASSLAYPLVPMLLATLAGWLCLYGQNRLSLLAFIATPLVAGLATLVLAALLGLMVPTVIPPRPEGTGLRLAHLNCLWYDHTNIQPKLDYARASNADVVVLNEVNNELLAASPSLADIYPHHFATREHNPTFHLEMLVLSRWPITHIGALNARLHLYKIDRPKAPFYLLHIHPQSPYLPMAMAYRNDELVNLAAHDLPAPLIAVGDVNTTPWDANLQPLRARLNLQGTWLPTHPALFPITPIDLILTSPNLPPATLHRIRVQGTDHLGLIMDMKD